MTKDFGQNKTMLTFILIGGLVWLVVALGFVLALAAAARKQVSPVAVNNPGEAREEEIISLPTPEASPVSTSRSEPVREPAIS
jgi:hypothetical protein